VPRWLDEENWEPAGKGNHFISSMLCGPCLTWYRRCDSRNWCSWTPLDYSLARREIRCVANMKWKLYERKRWWHKFRYCNNLSLEGPKT